LNRVAQSKIKRKAQRNLRRHLAIGEYRESCRDAISLMRQQRAEPALFRTTLKNLRHQFTAAIAGRKASP
jgi:hypothetical protein